MSEKLVGGSSGGDVEPAGHNRDVAYWAFGTIVGYRPACSPTVESKWPSGLLSPVASATSSSLLQLVKAIISVPLHLLASLVFAPWRGRVEPGRCR